MPESVPSLNIQRIDTRRDDVQAALDGLREKLSPRGDIVSEAGRQRTMAVFGEPLSPQQVVERITQDVRDEGLAALLRYTEKLDGAKLAADQIRVSRDEIAEAHAAADPAFLSTIRRIRDNIVEYQSAILHKDVEVTRPHGVSLRQRYIPLERIGICVPGGAAAYPSTVLMTAVPAKAAGVEQIVVVAPPTDFGANNPDVLATCHEIGVTDVYRIGGAQAVAAMAYGVEGLSKVDKIVGPGNLFVALAKKHVYGEVDIDSIAGPSEVVVIADESTRPEFTAADMLAQAEHAPGASILVTWSEEVLEATAVELAKQVAKLSRSELTIQSLRSFGCLILVRDETEACKITDAIAPEHLHIATDNAGELIKKIRNAGATFLGNYSPVALGDYAAGPSHVLPTSGTARWASGLTANDFLRTGSIISYSETALKEISSAIQTMADKEGLTAHRASVDIRLG
ncbi:MAG: histidinol dehydrogenase [Planctomycetaceae bacterium]|nr:histidinol dehydrogenase [Planctomycetales bacterium]MCB9921963.1 histidinol dehydrogenase [Planctomycetaceae bacterium]